MKRLVFVFALLCTMPAWSLPHHLYVEQTSATTAQVMLYTGSGNALGASWGSDTCNPGWERGSGIPNHLWYVGYNGCLSGVVLASAYEFANATWYQLATAQVPCPHVYNEEVGEEPTVLHYNCWGGGGGGELDKPLAAPDWGVVKRLFR